MHSSAHHSGQIFFYCTLYCLLPSEFHLTQPSRVYIKERGT